MSVIYHLKQGVKEHRRRCHWCILQFQNSTLDKRFLKAAVIGGLGNSQLRYD
jgi:hypothetical protein